MELIRHICDEAGVEFILAFKAFALWKTSPFSPVHSSHHSLIALRSPLGIRRIWPLKPTPTRLAYEDDTFDVILHCSSHITFNSLSQFQHFSQRVKSLGDEAPLMGIRINPEHSEIETELYNPCAPGSRFGVLSTQLPDQLPEEITGFHCHCHCESSSFALENTLGYIEEKFGHWLPQIKWLNLGGGHLVTRKDYDVKQPH